MAKKVVQLLFCDLHDDDVKGVETIQFALDGTGYEVDVCEKHGIELRERLQPFVDQGRRSAGARRAVRGARGSRAGSGREHSAKIRAWAREQGMQVSERGRISAQIVEQYELAH
ncbi:histone-like nucleoid-structuring protein Lsr2 [Bailinhaonella thermotolerans]|uniref:Lsr2 family protein n=1 Tax=Bailinhaonella thermotolerans TaxID=1070861 RepID=A0A3A4AMT4_9ACTN|nr:Lsr2 family protein [Bailinhaonella thermotolerans]RJL22553.1 Lsr2 family protein [Bailinhaonella thermotolerans]